jgi:hypothetical protein
VINVERFKEVQTDDLVLFIELHKVKTFMQDSAPCCTKKLVMDSQKKERFTVLDWTGIFPDLNTIKNCWSFIKKKVPNQADRDH